MLAVRPDDRPGTPDVAPASPTQSGGRVVVVGAAVVGGTVVGDSVVGAGVFGCAVAGLAVVGSGSLGSAVVASGEVGSAVVVSDAIVDADSSSVVGVSVAPVGGSPSAWVLPGRACLDAVPGALAPEGSTSVAEKAQAPALSTSAPSPHHRARRPRRDLTAPCRTSGARGPVTGIGVVF